MKQITITVLVIEDMWPAGSQVPSDIGEFTATMVARRGVRSVQVAMADADRDPAVEKVDRTPLPPPPVRRRTSTSRRRG